MVPITEQIFRRQLQPVVSPLQSSDKIQETTLRQVSFDEGEITHAAQQPRDLEEKTIETKKPQASDASPTNFPSTELACFWFSREAKNLCCPKGNESSEEAVEDMIRRLDDALGDDGYGATFAQIIEGGIASLDLISKEEVVKTTSKACHVYTALAIASDMINGFEKFSFGKCCNQAVGLLATSTPKEHRVAGTTVARWFRDFRRTRSFSLSAKGKEALATRRGYAIFFHEHPLMYNMIMHHMNRYLRLGVSDSSACSIAHDHFVQHMVSYVFSVTPVEQKPHLMQHYKLDNAWTDSSRLAFFSWFQEALTKIRADGKAYQF